ncbi:class I SAM-dependent DNA methyltransferase [Patescibacteria group bacterium]
MKEYDYRTFAKYYDILELDEDCKKFNLVLEKILRRHKVKKVLDLTCGTGEQVIYLHRKGYDVTARDSSEDMISFARKKYPQLKFKQGDMRDASPGQFDAAISIFNSIGHLPKPDFRKALKNIKKNLPTGGIYVFDIFNFDFVKKNFIFHEFMDVSKEVDGMRYARFNKNKFDSSAAIMEMHQKTYIQKGLQKPKILKDEWDMQIYSVEEIKKILSDCNFVAVEFMDMAGKEFDPANSISLLTIAKAE